MDTLFDMIGNLYIDSQTLLVIVLVLSLLVVLLMILTVVLLFRVHKLTKRYDLFMRGKDCETLEDNIVEIYRKLQSLQNKDLANKDVMKMLNRNTVNALQKTGLVKYNAFEGMGGQSSFALALLNMEDTGFILNSMHNRDSCYLYIKEVHKGDPEVSLSREEKLALDRALGKREHLFNGSSKNTKEKQ